MQKKLYRTLILGLSLGCGVFAAAYEGDNPAEPAKQSAEQRMTAAQAVDMAMGVLPLWQCTMQHAKQWVDSSAIVNFMENWSRVDSSVDEAYVQKIVNFMENWSAADSVDAASVQNFVEKSFGYDNRGHAEIRRRFISGLTETFTDYYHYYIVKRPIHNVIKWSDLRQYLHEWVEAQL